VAGPPGLSGPQDPGTAPEASVPTCFRHPGRETYVSCVRCGRPACPDCLRSAAVGQQCVECIRQANRGVRRPSGAFGGQLVSSAVVTWTLVGINVAAYIAETVYSKTLDYGQLVGGPAIDPTLGQTVGVANGDWYRLITSAFLHERLSTGYGILHIAFNMWALIIVGPALERVLGRARFLTVYLVSALAGSVLFYLVGSPVVPAFGASGAVFGLFGAWFVMSRRLRLDSRQVVMLIVLNLVISFTVPGIAWQAHIGGLIAGTALTAAFVYAPRPSRNLIQVGATLAMLAILVIAVVLRDNNLAGTVRF
jgi:membrane associated rhomboid family serine protease